MPLLKIWLKLLLFMPNLIKDPVVLFQYQSPQRISTLLAGIKQFATDNSKQSLFDFFDIDNAGGAWLDQLGAYLNLPRPLIINPNVFIMDQSLTDGPDLLDSESLAPDDLYKIYLKSQILKRNSTFTIEEIISLLQFCTGASKILVSEKHKTVSIYLNITSDDQRRRISLISTLDRKWFGLPSGVSLAQFKVVTIPTDATFFIMDFSPTDNDKFLIV